jgi:hypothetical protein
MLSLFRTSENFFSLFVKPSVYQHFNLISAAKTHPFFSIFQPICYPYIYRGLLKQTGRNSSGTDQEKRRGHEIIERFTLAGRFVTDTKINIFPAGQMR